MGATRAALGGEPGLQALGPLLLCFHLPSPFLGFRALCIPRSHPPPPQSSSRVSPSIPILRPWSCTGSGPLSPPWTLWQRETRLSGSTPHLSSPLFATVLPLASFFLSSRCRICPPRSSTLCSTHFCSQYRQLCRLLLFFLFKSFKNTFLISFFGLFRKPRDARPLFSFFGLFDSRYLVIVHGFPLHWSALSCVERSFERLKYSSIIGFV